MRKLVTLLISERSAWSWLFEVLPVWLLILQSLAAISCHGDVDGRSSQPLFAPVLKYSDKWMSSANAKIQTLLGRWSIQERHNIDEFMEGVFTLFASMLSVFVFFCDPFFFRSRSPWLRIVAARAHRARWPVDNARARRRRAR